MGRELTDQEKRANVIRKLCELEMKLIPLHTPTATGCSCGTRLCGSVGKHPVSKGWQKNPITHPQVAIKTFMTKNVGVLTGSTGLGPSTRLIVLDVDNKNDGGISLHNLELEHGKIGDTLTVRTGNGFHYYFKVKDDVEVPNSAGLVGPGIDVRGEGGYVVAPPSSHANGKSYSFVASASQDIAWMPEWLLEAATSKRRKEQRSRSLVKAISGGRNDHLTSIAGMMRRNGLSETAIREALLIENEIQCEPPLEEVEVRNIAHSIASYPTDDEEDWKNLLTTNHAGQLVKSEANVSLIMTHSDVFKGCITYDEFSGEGTWIKQPNSVYRTRPLGPKVKIDTDFMEIQHIMSKEYMNTFQKRHVQDAIMGCMQMNSYDSLKEHVMGLKRIQSRPRLDTWMSDFLGAKKNKYTEIVGRKFLIGMIARALKPGCKMDNMLILESPKQGLGKSTACQILGGHYFDDGPIETKNKDMLLKLRKCWLYEVGELAGMTKSQVEAVKHFVTDTSDSYREPYGRATLAIPRRCVFIGTTNESHYLSDNENRRFWPVRVASKIDIVGLAKYRDSLFAEAREAFLAGEQWWPTAKEQTKLFTKNQVKRNSTLIDPWTEELEFKLSTARRKGITFLSNNEIWAVVGVDPEKRSGGLGKRLSNCMWMLGWKKARTGKGRGYRYDHKVGIGNELLQEMSEEAPTSVPGGIEDEG